MKIKQPVLEKLFQGYLDDLNLDAANRADATPFKQAIQLIEDNLGGYFDWDRFDESSRDNHDVLNSILNKCLIFDQHNRILRFDELAAREALLPLQQLFPEARPIYLARDIQTTGLQEKYLKSQLTSVEPLTELDIKRFIINTGMQGKIHVTNLNERDIGLILRSAAMQQQDSNAPYSVPLMINAGTEGEPVYPQWLSVIFNVDPLRQDVKYTINAGYQLSDAQKDAIEKRMVDAIQFDETSNVSGINYRAFPLSTIVPESFVSHSLGKLNGYSTLHALYRNESLRHEVVNQDEAYRFSELQEDLYQIKRSVYALALQSIQMSPAEQEALNPQVAENFELGQIKGDVFQRHLVLLSTPKLTGVSQHPLVVDRISSLQLYHKKATFPGEHPNPPLMGLDYQQYLLQVNDKFKQSGIPKVLDEMEITCFDNAALEGLIAYTETKLPLPFETLTLNIDALNLSDPHVVECFLFNLKTMLLTLSDMNLQAFKFIDTTGKLSPYMIQNLVDFISKRAIAIDFLLPEPLQQSPMQRHIDEVVSDHIQQRNRADFDRIDIKASQMELPLNRQIRKRPIPKKQGFSTDVELQEEQQVELIVAPRSSTGADAGEVEMGESIIFNAVDFQEALDKSELAGSANSYLVSSNPDEAYTLFCNWVGALSVLNAFHGVQLSKAACEELLRHKEKFQFGLDFNNLPAGFIFKTDDRAGHIHFDENLKQIAQRNPLQVQTTELPGEKALTNTQFNQWLALVDDANLIKHAWDKLDNALYNREAHQLFKLFLPQLLLLNDANLARLFALCFNENNILDVKKFKFLMENAAPLKTLLLTHHNPDEIALKTLDNLGFASAEAIDFINQFEAVTPGYPDHLLATLVGDNGMVRDKITHLLQTIPTLNLNALLQLYTQWGEKGIDELTTIVEADPALLTQLDSQLFSHSKTYATVIGDEYKEAMAAIKGFTSGERVWFNTLLAQHALAQQRGNLAELVNAFKTFKEALRQLPTPSQAPLIFPDTCEVQGVKSLPVALSRMLSLLKHCKEGDRPLQWQKIGTLDLSSTGMINPVSRKDLKQWAFITPEMNINETIELFPVMGLKEYRAPVNWSKSYSQTKPIAIENFFRLAAFQEKNGQMPLAFYQHVHDKIKNSGLSLEVQKGLYPLFVGSSTGVYNVQQINTLLEGTRDVDLVIKLIQDTPLPGITPAAIKEQARITILDALINLSELPPLPILTQVIFMSSSALSNPFTAISNLRRLKQVLTDLDKMAKIYDVSLYQGMQNYRDEDFKNADLFFNYMAIVNKIDEGLTNQDSIDSGQLMSFISTFKLAITDLDPIMQRDFNANDEPFNVRRREALKLLRQLSIQANPQLRSLNPDDFTLILGAIRTSNQPIELVFKNLSFADGQPLAAYFPNGLLEQYGKPGISEAVALKLAANFNEPQQAQLSQLLLRFSLPGDHLQYEQLIDKLILITQPMYPIEKNIFIKKITTAMGLYTHHQSLDDPTNFFMSLLNSCSAHQSVDELMNFMAAERHLFHHCPENKIDAFFVAAADNDERVIADLSEKAVLYMNTLSPAIKAIPELAISEFELTPRLQETLLKTPIAQCHADSTVVSEKEAIFDGLLAMLGTVVASLDSENEIDMSALHEALDSSTNAKIVDDLNAVLTSLESENEIDMSALHKAVDSSTAKVVDDLDAVVASLDIENKIDMSALHEAVDSFTKAKVVDDLDTVKTYQQWVNENNRVKLSPVEVAGIVTNPAILLLGIYLVDKEALPEVQREIFERQYGEQLKALLEKHPSIILNKDLFQRLIINPEFINSLAEKETLVAASSPDLLDDPIKLGLVFQALEKDLNGIAEFKKKTETIQKEISDKKQDLKKYPSVFAELYKKINDIAKKNPTCKTQFFELFDAYLSDYSPGTPEHPVELLKYLMDLVSSLEKSFASIHDKNWVLSLCLHFNGEEFKPRVLLALLFAIERVEKPHQAMLLKIAVVLLNNEREYSIEDFTRLCLTAKESEALMGALEFMYKEAPFPTIEQVLEWHDNALRDMPSYANSMQAAYQAYNKAPCPRELTKNGFHVDIARTQLEKFKGFDGSSIDLAGFYAETVLMRDRTTDELMVIFKSFNPGDLVGRENTLVAVAAELLHRSKGKLGDSMEINTTQYLSILSALKTPGHVTSEIGTGEGKSRIMMIAIACQFAQGKTVDFLTSDASLATRDFVKYQAYFDLIGAKSSMIMANTDPSQYQIGGINFSDPSNLSLFRNKARSIGVGAKVIDPDETQRALLLDEADKTYFDVADTRFNYSKEGDESIRGMPWVYPLFMEYFAEDKIQITPTTVMSALALYSEDVDLSREKFLQFASGRCTAAELMRLKALSYGQLDDWQVSAVTASQLQFKEDFVIEPDILISTAKGPKISSEAQLLFGNRVSKQSKFSFGVHQFLHARLNRARNNLNVVEDEKLREALSACEQQFFVPDEKQIVYSSTSKNLLDDYEQGTLKAVTGTAGSLMERQEARVLHGLSTRNAKDQMHFIDVPRDKGMRRRDHALRLTGNSHQQLMVLVEQIKVARANHQPILVIAENDEKSEILFKKLSQIFNEEIQHIHSQLSSKDEARCIDLAGNPGQISISTDMIGRGVDILLKGQAREHGLHVMITYLPRERDLGQIVGRSGRLGAAGDSSLILDKQELKQTLGKTTLSDGYYKNVEAYIQREQSLMDKRSQTQRLIKSSINDVRKVLTYDFHEKMLNLTKPEDRKKLLHVWIEFYDKSDKAWNEQWPHIQKTLAAYPIDMNQLSGYLQAYETQVQTLWNTLRRKVQETDVKCTDGQKPMTKLLVKIPSFQLSEAIALLLAGRETLIPAPVKIYEHYDTGHEGRAVQYKHWSIPLIASLKGYANLLPFVHFSDARRPFANTRAWLEGHGELFADFRASPHKWKIGLAMLLGVIGSTVGVGLILTGVFSPLGIGVLGLSSLATTAMIAGIAGLAAGAVVGVAGGAIGDALSPKGIMVKQPLEILSTETPLRNRFSSINASEASDSPRPPSRGGPGFFQNNTPPSTPVSGSTSPSSGPDSDDDRSSGPPFGGAGSGESSDE